MTKQELLDACDLFLFDLDGTVYLGETPIAGAAEALGRLRGAGKRIVYLTNNSSKTHAEYENKLRALGLWGAGDSVYTSADATAEYLNAHAAGKRVYLLATPPVTEAFRAAGVRLVEEDPDVCVLAYDTTLTFEKMRRFNEYLAAGKILSQRTPMTSVRRRAFRCPMWGAFLRCSSAPADGGPTSSAESRSPSWGRASRVPSACLPREPAWRAIGCIRTSVSEMRTGCIRCSFSRARRRAGRWRNFRTSRTSSWKALQTFEKNCLKVPRKVVHKK